MTQRRISNVAGGASSGRSSEFALVHQAILARKNITFVYEDKLREVSPHILGSKSGEETLLAYQFGGGSKSPLPEWRCFYLSKVREARLVGGPWRSGSEHRTTQRCVDEVYIDVNIDVPNQPGRR
jgi:predicted DNA-binding transcriptional regulator YafY